MPTNSLSNIPMSITAKAFSFNFSMEEENRKDIALLNKDFYYGKQEQSLNLVSTEQECMVVNLTKPIVAKRAGMLYANPPVREFDGPRESIKFIEKVYEENQINFLLQCADLAAELTGSAIIHPEQSDNMENGIRLRLFDASQISPLADEDDPDKLEALSIVKLVDRISESKQTEVQRVLKQQIWTDDSVVTYEGEVLVESESNELGFIPFVNFKAEEVHDQWLGHAPATSTRMLNEDFNQLLTDLGFMIKMQAGTPIALSGYPTGESMVVHPGRAITLPVGADAKVLNTSPKIMDTLNTLNYLEERMYETSSVPKVSVVGGGEASSGRELMIRWFPLLQVFQNKALRWERYELNLANMILRVMGMEELADLSVTYTENSVLPFTEAEDTLLQDIQLNIVTPHEELMRRKPELKEKEALSHVLRNAQINEVLGLTQSDADMVAGNPMLMPQNNRMRQEQIAMAQEEPQEDSEEETDAQE